MSSVSVPCFINDQLKVYMSVMFENRSSKNSTPSHRNLSYIPSNFRKPTAKERPSTPAVAIAMSSVSVPCFINDQIGRESCREIENRSSKNSTPNKKNLRYIPSNFRKPTARERP